MEDRSGISKLLFSPQSEDDTRFAVILLDDNLFKDDDEGNGAVLKSSFAYHGSNLGGDEEQGMRVIEENIGKNALTVQCNIAQTIHGTMSEGGEPATLIVFQFAFMPRDKSQRFKKAEITISFSAGEVTKITPDGAWVTFQSETQQELSHSINPGLEAGIGPAKATVGYTWQLKKNTSIEGYSTVSGCTQMRRQSGSIRKARKNTILWALQENEQTKSGIPSFMQAAALLKREATQLEPMGQKFSAEITIQGEIGNQKWVSNKLADFRKMSGKCKRGEDIFFNPENNGRAFDNVNNLGEVKLDTYKQLVTIRPWVDGNEMATNQVIVPPEVTKDGFVAPSPAQVNMKPVAASTAPDIVATDLSVEDRAKNINRHPGDSSEELYGSRTVTAAFTLPNPTSVDLTSEDTGGEDWIMSLSIEEKQQRLEGLEEELLLVRNETRLVTQLIMLGREEGRLLKERRKLKGLL
ncbi:hypothetical protein CFAM422_002629 [Trichoderma lentiforme]|uniref:Uncharacterized protein n=1 Tax=Trichoderma lentiforme TaxID=1567552 RepID=A0A9P4XMR3_9HYPO|nr:hypothetical protein CFAM422_002629 [Trichoderma lentiforme]